jgi:hypothetical protein
LIINLTKNWSCPREKHKNKTMGKMMIVIYAYGIGGYPFSDKPHPEYGTAVAQGLLHVDLRVLHHPLLNLQMSGEPLLFGLTSALLLRENQSHFERCA